MIIGNKILVDFIFLITSLLAGNDNPKFIQTKIAFIDSTRVGDLLLILQTQDRFRHPTETFRYGENMYFCLRIINESEKSISLGPWDFPVFTHDFFTIYYDSGNSGSLKEIGKPFTIGANSRDLLPEIVNAKSEIQYISPWFSNKPFRMPIQILSQNSNKIFPESRGRFYEAKNHNSLVLVPGSYTTKVFFNLGEDVTLAVKFKII